MCFFVCLKKEENVPLVEFMHLVFTRVSGETNRRRLGSLLLYLCYVVRALINSLVCRFCGCLISSYLLFPPPFLPKVSLLFIESFESFITFNILVQFVHQQ